MLGEGFLSGQQVQGQAPLLQHSMSNEPLTSGLASPMSDGGGANSSLPGQVKLEPSDDSQSAGKYTILD